ncbi:oxidoreductase, partial [Mycobacterium sp. ITM-2017-0098]
MGLFDKFRGRRRRVIGGRATPAADLRYLQQWVAEHHGVEAFIEPKTTVTELTVVLVAADGEW